jgi:lipoprotein signal peptidase
VRRRRGIAAIAALVVAGIALVHEVLRPTPFHHARSSGIFILAVAIAFVLLVLAPRIPSLGVALGAGIAAGGALGTVISGIAWSGVPDPLVRGGIAFNLSDLAIAGGDALLLASVLVYALRHRDRLREPI